MSDDGRLINAIKASKATWYVADAPSNQGGTKATVKTLRKISNTVPTCNIMVMSAGTQQLCIAARIVADNCPFTAAEWVQSCGTPNAEQAEGDDNVFFAVVQRDIDAGVFPTKFIESARGLTFAFLRKHKMLDEAESDDDEEMLAMDM